jgi:RND superfamily putative drug exporter
VFAAFALGDDRQLKLFGLGLAIAVLLDATIVRMLLVPATMELLGDRNWWIPKWLDRLLPNIDVEGHAHHEGDEPNASILDPATSAVIVSPDGNGDRTTTEPATEPAELDSV